MKSSGSLKKSIFFLLLQALDDLILSTQQDTLEVSIRPSYFYQSKGVKI